MDRSELKRKRELAAGLADIHDCHIVSERVADPPYLGGQARFGGPAKQPPPHRGSRQKHRAMSAEGNRACVPVCGRMDDLEMNCIGPSQGSTRMPSIRLPLTLVGAGSCFLFASGFLQQAAPAIIDAF
jgi:hypothetical protein